jgi:SAM-dependent methyltransferase
MTGSTGLSPFKRLCRNYLRVRNRILPTELPPPFFHASDIKAVTDYFSGFTDDRPDDPSELSNGLRGHCYLCKAEVLFRIDIPTDAGPVNWRETLVCPHCKLINRWRSCLHVFEAICEPTVDDRIYLTETLSPIYQNLVRRFPQLSASEYFPDHEFGEMVQTHTMPVRNEDVTKLSFRDASKDIILCFDVLEHVPDYHSALREFHRVLDKGGQLVISVPFSFQRETFVRAKLDDEGNIEHLTEPCYHGDPLSDQGVLSYYDFGMDLLDELREAGFQECFLSCYYSKKWTYLNRNVVYIARKLKPSIKKRTMAKYAWEDIRYKKWLSSERLAGRFRHKKRSVPDNKDI